MSALKYFWLEWKMKGPKSRMFMALGLMFLLATIVGVFLPIIPQVPFAIISVYFFSRGSTAIHYWIRYNKYFGRPVRNWEDCRNSKISYLFIRR